ncbi:hypothetical protein Dimus_012974, partial [Dionaea muscipula]
KQKWEKLFARRDLVYKSACREFYKNLTVSISKRKEVAKSRVHGVEIELDGMSLAIILGISRNYGLCDYIKELKRENGVWWLEIGANRRRDDVDNEEVPAENEETDNVEINKGENQEENIGWETQSEEEFVPEDVNVELEAQVHGEPKEKEVEIKDSGSREKLYEVVDGTDERSAYEDVAAPAVPAAAVQTSEQQKGKTKTTRVNLSSNLPDSVLLYLQAKMDRALKANTKFQELYQQLKSNPSTFPNP